MRFYNVIVFFLILSIPFNLLSQKKETSYQTITFGTQTIDSTFKKEAYKPRKNFIQIGLISGLSGFTPINYERELTSFMSFQIGVGITYRSIYNDFLQYAWEDGEYSDFYSQANNDIADIYNNYKYRKSILGGMISIAPKFYPFGDGVHGISLYPMLEYKIYNYKTKLPTAVQNFGSILADERDVERSANNYSENNHCIDFSLNFGGHFPIKERIFIEWRIGAGYRREYNRRLDIGYDFQNAISYRTRNYENNRPYGLIDIFIGGAF